MEASVGALKSLAVSPKFEIGGVAPSDVQLLN